MSARCKGEPVSWLRLERFHLGEVDAAERAAIEAHLASCAACAEALASLAEDDAVALPPLPVTRLEPAHRGRSRARPRVGIVVTGLALAAALLLGVGHEWKQGGEIVQGTSSRTKGDAVAFSLVRDDDERIDEAAGTFRQGDRFKAVVTCPPSMEATFDLVVYDASGASFPLAAGRVACGNGVPLPGAFRLSGSDEEKVCLVWAVGGAVDRAGLASGAPAERSACKTLTASAPK